MFNPNDFRDLWVFAMVLFFLAMLAFIAVGVFIGTSIH